MENIKYRDIKVLKKRRDHLLHRIGMSNIDLTYDKQEAAALTRAIKELEKLMLERFQ